MVNVAEDTGANLPVDWCWICNGTRAVDGELFRGSSESTKMTTNIVQPSEEVQFASGDAQKNMMRPARLLSLDALRGFDMLWIIGGQEIVRSLAGVWPSRFSNAIADQFEHVPWVGLHVFDVIWTLFMFMVGVSLTFSLAKRKLMNESHRSIYSHAIVRALIMFVLGMAAQGNLLDWSLTTLHSFYSVLHGIAVGYLIATIVVLNLRTKGQAAVTAIFLVLYWILLETISVPGVGRGVLTPTGNAATYIDSLVMGRFYYGENTWFPELPWIRLFRSSRSSCGGRFCSPANPRR